ncbi:MAG: DNA-binding protein [Bryobacterales bacterium]|nr:DNA-binding protein [Bryobacterales bacterium]
MKGDVFTAKNYLTEPEATQLDRLVSAFLDLAEDRASRRQQTTMTEWMSFVDSYLKFADREILTHAGRISHEKMQEIIGKRYALFDAIRRESERLVSEDEHVREIDAELKKLTKQLEATKPARKVSKKKESA